MKKRTVVVLVAMAVIAVITVLVVKQRQQGHSQSIRIGALLPLTGDAAAYGKYAQNGFEMAVEQANVAGGIDGRSIAIAYEDTQADPKTGV